jgi:hypothetical protein
MRTSQICPTCTTYINSLCVIYNGTYLSNINASPLDALDKILTNINSSVGAVNTSITTLNSSVITINGNVALKESSSNKSTDGTFNTGVPSATLFPTQSAVATYVANNAPTLDQVLIAGDVSTTPLTIGNTLTTPTESSIIDSGIITLESAIADTSTTYQSTGIVIDSIINTDQMVINFNNNDQTIDFPSTTGTLALEKYKVYTAFLSYDGTSTTTIVLQNTIGNGSADGINDIAWAYTGVFFTATMTAGPFTNNKTAVPTSGIYFPGSGLDSYCLIGLRNTDAIVRIFSKRLSDGATGALPFANQLIEIRVYP